MPIRGIILFNTTVPTTKLLHTKSLRFAIFWVIFEKRFGGRECTMFNTDLFLIFLTIFLTTFVWENLTILDFFVLKNFNVKNISVKNFSVKNISVKNFTVKYFFKECGPVFHIE